jgi:regulatory protein
MSRLAQDDARFTLHYVETRAARGRGPLRLRRDLSALGVERAVVDRALAEAFGPDGSGGPSVESLAQQRLAQLQGLAKPVARRRLLAFLARRGFVGPPVHQMVMTIIS